MRRHFGLTLTMLPVTALTLLAAAMGPAAQAQARLPYGPIPVDCDRACLEGLVDQCLAAVVAHDPKRLRQGGGGPNDIAGLDKATPEPWWKQAIPSGQFRIENGLIRGIEMVGGSVPYPFNSAWAGGLSGK